MVEVGLVAKKVMKPGEAVAALLAEGFEFDNQEGSHRHYIFQNSKGLVTFPVPMHPGDLHKRIVANLRKAMDEARRLQQMEAEETTP